MQEQRQLFERITEEDALKIKQGGDILYLLILSSESRYDDYESTHTWEFVTGRQEVYDFIINMLRSEEDSDTIVDIDNSFIYADNPAVEHGIRISNKVSIYQFMKNMVQLGKVKIDETFDIEEYHQETMGEQ